MNFLLKVNPTKENSRQTAEKVIDKLSSAGHTCRLCADEEVMVKSPVETVDFSQGLKWCDVIITVGGDGTILNIGKQAAESGKPILGINTGHLGFLTALEPSELDTLDRIEDNDFFKIKKHFFLQVKINEGPWMYCLNDAVISKYAYSNTVDLAIYCNGNILMNFAGDGIIVATSTGSTAYSLSVGGPIVDSDLNAMVLSPVAPHTLNRTSMVLGSDKCLKITAQDHNDQKAYIAFDGADYIKIGKEDSVYVRLSEKYVSIYTQGGLGQLEKVDKKLKSR